MRETNFKFKTPGLNNMLEKLSVASGHTFNQTAELFLIAIMARKSAYGDLYGKPEPIAYEFVKTPDGRELEGEELYKDIYEQAQRFWLNVCAAFQAQHAYISILEGRADFKGLPADKQNLLIEKYPERFKPEYVQ
jgi:hypothetical protein